MPSCGQQSCSVLGAPAVSRTLTVLACRRPSWSNTLMFSWEGDRQGKHQQQQDKAQSLGPQVSPHQGMNEGAAGGWVSQSGDMCVCRWVGTSCAGPTRKKVGGKNRRLRVVQATWNSPCCVLGCTLLPSNATLGTPHESRSHLARLLCASAARPGRQAGRHTDRHGGREGTVS